MAKRDYYEVLGVTRSADADEIKRAHRRLVRQYHPDVNKNSSAATERFKEIQEAYDVLSDPEKRKQYDQFGHAGPPPPGAGDAWEAFRRGPGGSRTRTWDSGGGVSVEDFDFGDLFDQFFGGRGPAGSPHPGAGRTGSRATERGADIEYPITLSFEDAARGRTLPLQIRRGGKVESIEVKVPAGVNDGSRVRIKGKGDRGPGGQHGDLYIIVHVQAHPFYRRDGLDVLLELPISLYEALLGTKVSVPTLDGPVMLTVPAGTSSGAKLRIKGRGIERGSERGDQHVVIRIIVPRELDDEDRELVERLQRKRPVDARADRNW
jgi:DnaJ-class molecular chaperone